MLTMFLRAAILYTLVVIIMRCMGKRQIGEMQPYELVITILISDLASAPMSSSSIPLAHGIMPIAAIVLMQSLLTVMNLKSDTLRAFINGKPSILVRNGIVDEKELRKQAITLSELLEEARIAGVPSLSQIGVAVLEVSGDLSVFPISAQRPVSAADIQLETAYEGMTLALVLDGHIQKHNLEEGKLSESWLVHQLKQIGLSEKGVFLCTLDTSGVLCVQPKGQSALIFRNALSPQEVRW